MGNKTTRTPKGETCLNTHCTYIHTVLYVCTSNGTIVLEVGSASALAGGGGGGGGGGDIYICYALALAYMSPNQRALKAVSAARSQRRFVIVLRNRTSYLVCDQHSQCFLPNSYTRQRINQSINQPTNQQNQIKPNQIHRTPTSLPNGSLRGSWNSLPHAHRPSGGRIINHAWDASNASKGRLRFAFSPNASALYILPRHRSLFFNCQGHIFRTHARSCDISSLCYFT